MKRSVIAMVAVGAMVAASLLVWMAAGRERGFRRLIAEGDAALSMDQTYVAIEAFSGALVLKPESMLAHLKRGETYRLRGELNNALRDLGEATRLDPTAPQPLERLGDVEAALGHHDRAGAHYQASLSLDDRAPRVLYKLALARYRGGQPAQAVEPLRKAIGFDDRFAEAHYLLGLTLRERNQRQDAVRAIDRAVALNPAFVAAREELADLHMELGRDREELEQREALAALEPSSAERVVGLGLAYARTGRSESAVVTLGRAAERFASSTLVYTALGRVWLEMADTRADPVALRKALEALQAAASRPDATSEALALYGRGLLLSDQATQAERVLKDATSRLPADPAAFRYLAEAANRLGHASVARDAESKLALLQ